MSRSELYLRGFAALLLLIALPAGAQSFRVQCPTSTITHPDQSNTGVNNSEPFYTVPTQYTCSVPNGCGGTAGNVGYLIPQNNVNGALKCQQISGGDGYATMADGTQTFMFSFGPLSGLADIAQGLPGTEFPNVFNTIYTQGSGPNQGPNQYLLPGDPATADGSAAYAGGWGTGGAPTYTVGNINTNPTAPYAGALNTNPSFTYNGAVGLINDVPFVDSIYDISEGCSASLPAPCTASANTVTVILNSPASFAVGDKVKICGTGATSACNGPYDGTWTVSAVSIPNTIFAANFAFQFQDSTTGLADVSASNTATAASLPRLDGHVDPRQIMDIGVMNGNIPAPLMAFDEDDEFFLTLTNVGMIMRPDLFEQHTVHFHGYPNASSYYDGVPDASVAINIGGSFTYYYLAPDAGTYFWHCHITPPEHLQMGMVGQLYVRPRQNRVPAGNSLYAALQQQNGLGTTVDLRTVCNPASDILCSANMPAASNTVARGALGTLCNGQTALPNSMPSYVYNDGDGSTCYDIDYPIQMHGFDPNFHFVGMTFNPEAFVDMKDKYFLLNGRSYPDTVEPGPQATQSSDGRMHFSQPMNSIINIPAGGKALLRLVNLSVSEYHTLGSLGIPMHVIGYNAKLLRDQAGNNMDYYTNSITLGGGESLDVILDASDTSKYQAGQVFYVYSPNLDHLSNDAENFGGEMTEVNICHKVDPISKVCS